MRKNKFVIFILFYSILITNSNNKSQNKKFLLNYSYNENEIKELMLKDNNDIIYENSNGEITMNYKNIETQIIEHNNCHKSVSIKNSDDSVISDRRVKMQNNQEDYTVDIYTEPNGKISSILSDNQTIKFLQNEYNMTDVEYNNSIIIKNIKVQIFT